MNLAASIHKKTALATKSALMHPIPVGSDTTSLTENDFDRLAAFAHREFGLHLPPTKLQHVRSRMVKVLSQTQIPDFKTLCDRIEANPFAPERAAVISALTTNVTQFFREDHHFGLLNDALLKPRLDALKAGKRLRIWSAGCSAGQEPISIAMTILNLLPENKPYDIKILGTDIDPNIINNAKRFEYPIEEIHGIPEKYQKQYCRISASGKSFTVDDKIRKMIHLAELNLISEWPIKGPFDAIFCRNVAIYFDKATQAELWTKFSRFLSPGGFLMIGHSERVSGPATSFLNSIGITTYQKIGPRS